MFECSALKVRSSLNFTRRDRHPKDDVCRTGNLDGIRNKREGCGKRNIAGGYDTVGSDIRFCTFQCQTRLCIVISGIGLFAGQSHER